MRKGAHGLVAALGLAWLAATVLGLFRENVNWDELVLLSRSIESLHTGHLVGDGRPGLATVLLMPFAEGCRDAVDTVRDARLLWLLFLLSYLAGIGFVVREMQERVSEGRWLAPALAVALVVFVPAFPRWGLQVRSDQPSLAFALWGTVAWLASRRRPWLAITAGAGLGLGSLFSQKAIYVGALAALLFAGQTFILGLGSFSVRRETTRAVLAAAVAVAVVLGYPVVVGWFFTLQVATIDANLGANSFYRSILGVRLYRALLPTLAAHGFLALLLLVRTMRLGVAWRRLAVAWAVLGLGAMVAAFHGSRFPYFWLTLAVFPAVALAMNLDAVLQPFSRSLRAIILGGLLAVLLLKGAPAVLETTNDTQSAQHDALAFIERNFAPGDRGFHPEKALACRADPSPLPTYFFQNIQRTLSGPDGAENTRALVAEFRSRPVKFIVESFRLGQFPVSLLRFWGDAYVAYCGAVAVAGRSLAGKSGDTLRFEAVTAGEFRLHLFEAAPGARIRIGAITLGAGETIRLPSGEQRVELLGDVRAGALALALPEPPCRTSTFFTREAEIEVGGLRRW